MNLFNLLIALGWCFRMLWALLTSVIHVPWRGVLSLAEILEQALFRRATPPVATRTDCCHHLPLTTHKDTGTRTTKHMCQTSVRGNPQHISSTAPGSSEIATANLLDRADAAGRRLIEL